MTGVHWVNDAGYFLGLVLITNIRGIGACHQGEDVACIKPQGEVCPAIDTEALQRIMVQHQRRADPSEAQPTE